MSNSRYPLTYNDEHEEQVKEKFTSAMRGKSQLFIKRLQQADDPLVTFDEFKKAVVNLTS